MKIVKLLLLIVPLFLIACATTHVSEPLSVNSPQFSINNEVGYVATTLKSTLEEGKELPKFTYNIYSGNVYRQTSIQMRSKDDFQILQLPVGYYKWLEFDAGSLNNIVFTSTMGPDGIQHNIPMAIGAKFNTKTGFTVKPATITYIGDISVDVENITKKDFFGFSSSANYFNFVIVDNETENKEKLLREYPELLEQLVYEKDITRIVKYKSFNK